MTFSAITKKNILFFKNFQKGVDKPLFLCYNKDTESEVIKMKKNKVNKSHLKKEGEELQLYLHFRKRGSVVENKKGKGSYNRQKAKRERGGEE